MIRTVLTATGALCVAASFLAAPAAPAAHATTPAVRYASPTGVSTNPCTVAAPCDIVTAINDAPQFSPVVIEPGTYGTPAAAQAPR